ERLNHPCFEMLMRGGVGRSGGEAVVRVVQAHHGPGHQVVGRQLHQIVAPRVRVGQQQLERRAHWTRPPYWVLEVRRRSRARTSLSSSLCWSTLFCSSTASTCSCSRARRSS